jgi:hypothetical protein
MCSAMFTRGELTPGSFGGPSVPELRGNEGSLGFGEGDKRVHGRDVRGRRTKHVADLTKLRDAGAGSPAVLERVLRRACFASI